MFFLPATILAILSCTPPYACRHRVRPGWPVDGRSGLLRDVDALRVILWRQSLFAALMQGCNDRVIGVQLVGIFRATPTSADFRSEVLRLHYCTVFWLRLYHASSA